MLKIEIVPIKPSNGFVAFASFVLNRQFYISNIAIYARPIGNDYRLVFPDKTLSNEKQNKHV